MTMETFTPHASPRNLTAADLLDFGDRYGIDYRFPTHARRPGSQVILRGRVEELPLSCGLNLTHSSLEVLRPYEAVSTRDTAFFLLVVLEGCVQLTTAGERHLAQSGMAVTTHLGIPGALHAVHAPNQSLKTLTLALNGHPGGQPAALSGLVDNLALPAEPYARLWRLPDHLYQSLRHWQTLPSLRYPQQRLLLEGMALQLLAYGLGDAPVRVPALSPGERSRLEKIRRQLDQAPNVDYSVQQLADQAAMSISSFRSKFREMFGVPVCSYLRERRLDLARQYLLQGYSVQQAAHLSGYRHTTNFSTAFRKRYGKAPSVLG